MKFDAVNRMLIEFQRSNCCELKTESEWLIEGRWINSEEKPVYIVVPKYEYKYMDVNSGEYVEDTDLNHIEMHMAIEYGLVNVIENFDDISVKAVYDVRQTNCMDGREYNISRPILNKHSLVDILNDITGDSIWTDNETVRINNRTIYLNSISYREIAVIICNEIANWYTNNMYSEYIHNNTDGYKYSIDNNIVLNSLNYAIQSILIGKSYIKMDSMHSVVEALESMFFADVVTADLIQKLRFNTNCNICKVIRDAIESANIADRSDRILSLMESNYMSSRLKGV